MLRLSPTCEWTWALGLGMCINRRSRCHRVASSGRRVASPWPSRIVCLQWLAGTDPVSSSAREDDQDDVSSPCQVNDGMLGQLGKWQCRAMCAGAPWVSRAMWPNTDKRRCTGFKGSLPNFSHIWHIGVASGGIAIPSDGQIRGGASPTGNESGSRRGRLQRQQQ